MKTKTIDYFFDFLSPYSYLSWQSAKQNFGFEQIDLNFYPVILSRLIHHYETKGPAEIAPKRDYLFKDCLRYSHLNNIPFRLPKALPFNSLTPLRIIATISDKNFQYQLTDLFFHAAWGEGKDISEDSVIKSVLASTGQNIDEVLDKASSKDSRIILQKNLDYAIANGVFGLPSFLVDGELFWGNDSIPHLKQFIQGNDKYNIEEYQKYKTNYFL